MNEMNPTPTEEQFPAEDTGQTGAASSREDTTRRTVLVGRSITFIAFAFLVAGVYLAIQTGAWQPYVFIFLAFQALAATLAGAALVQRGRATFGGWLILATTLIAPAFTSLLFVSIGFVAVAFILVTAFFIIRYAMPRETQRSALVFALIALVMPIVAEWTQPAWRLESQLFLTISPILTAILGIVFIVVIARQTWAGSMRNKLLVAFIGVTVVATGLLGVFMYITTSNNLRDNLERELTSHTIDRATRIGDLFNEQIKALTTLSLNEVLLQAIETQNNSYEGSAADIQTTLDARDARWRAADAADNNNDFLVRANLTNAIARELTKYQQTFPDNIEVFITDVYGGLAGSTNRTSDYYQADEEWWQAAYNEGQGGVYISVPEFDESAGAVGSQIALPLRDSGSGEIIGILRTTFIVSPLATILGEKIGQTDETEIIIPGEPVTRIDYTGEYETIEADEFEALQAVAGQGMVEMEYEGEHSVVIQSPVRTLVGNAAVDNLGWVVVLSQEQNEAFAPVNTQVRGLVIVLATVVALAAAAAYFLSLLLVRPILRLTAIAEEVSAGDLDSRAEVTTSDEVGTLATTFNSMTSQLQETLQGLEQRVAERTQNLELAAEVGRSVSQVRALDIMLKDACELIQKEFDLYYTQVYLTNPSQTTLQLQAGTGEVGAQLLERAHSLPLNTGSINGRAAVEKRTVVISDTAESPTFRPNALLPDTRGEMAVPLIVGEKVVGVLDMQSSQPGTLTEEVLPAFEALAGQLAVAIQNATLVAEAQEARAEVEAQARRLVRASWGEHLDAIHKPEKIGFVFNHNEVSPLTEADAVQLSEEGRVVSAPISLTGEMLGSLVVEMDEKYQNEHTSELVNIVASQVAQQLENLRLLESAERFRYEAEQAARRQTREGWQEYTSTRTGDSLGYLYDLNEVRPYSNGQEDASALTLPLKARDEKIGKLSIRGLAADDKESFELASAVAERLGDHIESLRLFEETKQGQVELEKRAQQLAAVAEISTVSSKELDIEKMLKSMVHLTQRNFGLYHAHVFTFNENASLLEIMACGWVEGDEREEMLHGEHAPISLAQEQSLVARAARTGQAVIVNDVHNEPGWLPNPQLPDTRAEMAIPLMVGDQVLGVLDVQSDRLNAFSEEDANIQTTLASQVATALQNARSFTQAQRQAERETMLNTINQKIQSATSVEAVLQIAARELGHALGAPMTIAQLSMKDKN